MPYPEDGLRGEARENKNLANFNWTVRVNGENKIHTKGGSEYRVAADMNPRNLMCAKVNEHNPVYHDLDPKQLRKLSGLSKSEADKTNFNLRTNEYVPKERYMFPQTSAQELGWAMSVAKQVGKPTMTGAYNFRSGKYPVMKNAGPEDDGRLDQFPHNQGSFITRCGDPTCSAPKRKRRKPKLEKSDSAPNLGTVATELAEEQADRETKREKGLDGMDLVAMYTKKLRKTTKSMDELATKQKHELYGAASKWFKPKGQCDVTHFANTYVLCCGSGPYNKNQLMFSR
jgi:hypothetical protein